MNERPAPGFPPGPAFAVTPTLREWYASGDTEELEYIALSLAAAASVHLLADDPQAARRRVVVAADVDAGAVSTDHEMGPSSRGRIDVAEPIPLGRIAAIHVDDADAVAAVTVAAQHPHDELAAEEAADFELLWYATQELEQLLSSLQR